MSLALAEHPQTTDTTLMGLAHLMTRAFRGENLTPVANQLIARAGQDDTDANALMDLSTVLMLQGIKDIGLATQAQALQISRVYELPSARPEAVRLLALMAPGDLMTNAPLPFLFEDSDVALTMLYLVPGEALPETLPAHDVMVVAISESGPTRGLPEQLAPVVDSWPRPVINPSAHIIATCRDRAHRVLSGAPGICMPGTSQASRAQLQALCSQQADLQALLPDGAFPLIVRPVDSHAGHDLDKVDSLSALHAYLDRVGGDEFFISRFVDYSNGDGLFRKYRVALVDGVPFAAHMGVSAHWMIHYLNAGMTDSAAKRAEEEAFMRGFESGFALRHGIALKAIAQRFGLSYLVVDCAETPQGELLVFEVDPGAVVHRMDPVELFPYKPEHMEKVFTAFRSLLLRRAFGTVAGDAHP